MYIGLEGVAKVLTGPTTYDPSQRSSLMHMTPEYDA